MEKAIRVERSNSSREGKSPSVETVFSITSPFGRLIFAVYSTTGFLSSECFSIVIQAPSAFLDYVFHVQGWLLGHHV